MVLNTEMPLTEVEAIELEGATVRQSECELWFEARLTLYSIAVSAQVAKRKRT